MSQTNQLVNKTVEMQQNAIEQGQQAVEDAVDIPLEQSIQFQKSAGQLFLNGLEIGNWLQNRSMELTRNTLSTYFNTVENAAQRTEEMTEQGLEGASSLGQAGMQSQQGQLTDMHSGQSQGSMRMTQPQPQAMPQQRTQPQQQATPQQQAPSQQQTPPRQQAPTQQQQPYSQFEQQRVQPPTQVQTPAQQTVQTQPQAQPPRPPVEQQRVEPPQRQGQQPTGGVAEEETEVPVDNT